MRVLEQTNSTTPPMPAPAMAASVQQTALILGAAIGLAAGFAGLYFSTLPIFLKPIAASFGWGRADTSAVVVMSMLGSAIGAPLLGRVIDRSGARRVIGCSTLLFAASLFVFSLLPGAHVLFAAASLLLGFFAVGCGPAGYLAVLPQVFDRRLGLALSLSMVGIGVGAAIFPLLAQAMVTGYGWRAAYQVLAVIALVAGAGSFLLLGIGPRGPVHVVAVDAARQGDTLATALRNWRFWTLLAAIFVATAAALGAVVHVAALFTDRGIPPGEAAQLATFPGIGMILGRFGAGLLMDAVFAPLVAALGFVLGAIGLAAIGLPMMSSFPLLALGGLMFGLALGVEGDFAAFAVRRYFGTHAFGAIYGTTYAVYALGGLAGPILFGIGYDRLGNYGLVLLLASAGFLLAAACVLTLGRYRFVCR